MRQEAEPAALSSWLPLWTRTPWAFGFMALTLSLLLLTSIFARHHMDLSVFIQAGDRYVDALKTSVPIIIGRHSDGYDGQFYYALALHPFSAAPAIGGVTFDHHAWRAQRILYPLLAHLLDFGKAANVAPALFVLNCASLFAQATLAASRSVRKLHGMVPALAIILWPGALIALTHDTTELLACALLLAAMLAYLQERLLLFAVFGALAALTRETTSLMLGGIVLAALPVVFQSATRNAALRKSVPALCAAAALVPFILWHIWLGWELPAAHDAGPLQSNLALPLVGVSERLYASFTTILAPHGVSVKARLLGLYSFATATVIVGFSIRMAGSAISLVRSGGPAADMAIGWLCMLGLMSVLSASGPWIEPFAIFRAFSECWVVGWLMIALDPKPAPTKAIVAVLPLAVANWALCLLILR